MCLYSKAVIKETSITLRMLNGAVANKTKVKRLVIAGIKAEPIPIKTSIGI